MAIFEATDTWNQSIGKDVPAMGPFRNFKVNLVGPGGGKVRGAIKAGLYISRYISKSNSRLAGSIAGTSIASGLALNNAADNQFNQTLRPVSRYNNSFRSGRTQRTSKRNCCTCCINHKRGKYRKPGQGYLRRNVGRRGHY